MEWFLGALHAIARWRGGIADSRVQQWPVEFRDRLQQISVLYLHRYLEKVLQSKKQLLSGANPNKQLLWEELMLDWGAVLRAGQQRR
jgi:DNA polymerase-3 subunit delta'